ncbi:WxL protein peptidoglycan domain-containing protein [Rhizomonospora bruguierae]|uniref:WxL protein peptidoglycan domain-containing protein n=1 Tax=Rhizomonospora bruguierae TaxID=1581705 RepID=UPI001BD0858F|nr:DUF916 domain-containing protein [Micromonospora sp. NBRC 107566]
MTRSRRTWAGALAAAAMLVTLAPAAPARAAPAGDELKWSVVPSSPSGPRGRQQFDYQLSPGEQITDWVSVRNLGGKPLRLNLYATDAFTATDGGFALLPADRRPADVGTWITLPARELVVPAGKRAEIPWQLAVPRNAPAGDHIGGLIASATEDAVNEKGQRVSVERRVAARVYLRIPGKLSAATTISALDVRYDNPVVPVPGGRMTVTYRIANTGNIRVAGSARVQVTGPFGARVASSETIDIPELLPDSEVRLTRTLDSVFPAGRLTVVVNFIPRTTDRELEPVSRSAGVWAPPWMVLAAVGLLLIGLVVWLLRRRLRRAPAEPSGGLWTDAPAAAVGS